MVKDIMGEEGLHFDEFNKLWTIKLKKECKNFVDKIGQFQKIIGGLIELVDQLAKEAENEKMKAIGAWNLLKSTAERSSTTSELCNFKHL
uniref:Uncharacterized protein n=1 Tax=Rhinopithecus roxellana TaxID=61622 RepID=A0A2K6QVB1_RHIRO